MQLKFVVFSYNRGRFLENCIASLEQCATNIDVTIFDDNSDDPSTRETIGMLARQHRVACPGERAPGQSKHGGLYANMQSAFERLADDDLICFIQDDMQLVRSVSNDEIDSWSRYFDTVKRAGIIHPAFFKGCNRASDAASARYDATLDGYLIDRVERSAGSYYSDILVARAGNLRNAGWRFLDRESRNEQQARSRFTPMLYLRNPFVTWLPFAPAWRGKSQTAGLRLASRLGPSGFYPLRTMSSEERRIFMERDPSVLPVAEDFLTVDGPLLPQPWLYYPLQGRRWLKWLNSAELAVRRSFK